MPGNASGLKQSRDAGLRRRLEVPSGAQLVGRKRGKGRNTREEEEEEEEATTFEEEEAAAVVQNGDEAVSWKEDVKEWSEPDWWSGKGDRRWEKRETVKSHHNRYSFWLFLNKASMPFIPTD